MAVWVTGHVVRYVVVISVTVTMLPGALDVCEALMEELPDIGPLWEALLDTEPFDDDCETLPEELPEIGPLCEALLDAEPVDEVCEALPEALPDIGPLCEALEVLDDAGLVDETLPLALPEPETERLRLALLDNVELDPVGVVIGTDTVSVVREPFWVHVVTKVVKLVAFPVIGNVVLFED